MEVSKILKRQIVLEIIAFIFLVCVIIYSIFAITKSGSEKISSVDNIVMVLDDTKVKKIEAYSDGEALSKEGVTYTVTNNESDVVTYAVVLVPNNHDENVLNQIRISVDDLYIEDLTSLERSNGGYVVTLNDLKPGYTKVHLIKYWYKLNTDYEIKKNDIKFEYRLVKKDSN